MAMTKFERYIQTLLVILFVVALLGYLVWSIVSTIWFPTYNDKTIKFEVTGITNSENASTLVQVHYECIKYCLSYATDYKNECWRQCALLGKEGCSNEK